MNSEELIVNRINVGVGALDDPNSRGNAPKNFTNQRGITLIALIITIIILLTLAGVSISLITGQDSIIGKANEAKITYNSASQTESNTMSNLLNLLEEYTALKPGDAGYVASTTDGIQRVEDGTGATIPVPVGFSYLTGTKSTGFVIKNDDDNNEFVWIPCDLASNNPEEGILIYQSYEWEAHNTGHYTASQFTEYYTNNTDIELGETNVSIMNEIDTSIGSNKGFYISRYEAGTEAIRREGQALTAVVSKATNLETPVYAYYWLYWTQAIEVAEGLYNKEEDNVQSRLINGRGWDTALKFIEQEDTNFPGNSAGKAWYSNNWSPGNSNHETGKPLENNANMIKNIYDMAGNRAEWTATRYNSRTQYHALRGGNYDNSGTGYPASNRSASSSNWYGFRIALYL